MKIALIGYGKMGKAIEEIALQQGHEIVLKINSDNKELLSSSSLQKADVAIEFSTPESAIENIEYCLQAGIPLVCGTTGWTNALPQIQARCTALNGAMVYASNFSIGVNLFFELNTKLAALMANQPQYEVILEEIHHTQKLDAPSGTAISLANGIIKKHDSYDDWKLDENGENTIPIVAKRIEDVPGTHTVTYESDVDTINIEHIAHTRQGFALGAVVAAEWIADKTGVFTMNDVLNIG